MALQHGLHNPIVIEDDEEEEEACLSEEDEEEYMEPLMAVLYAGQLVLIKDVEEELEEGVAADVLAAESAPPAYAEVDNN